MVKKPIEQPLGYRERQIMDAVYRIGEGSVADIMEAMPEPPSYSSVRKMMNVLEQKGLLRHRQDGTRYIYRPTTSHQSASRSAASHLLTTFFSGSIADAVNSMLDVSERKVTKEDLDRLQKVIEEARRAGQ